MEIHSKIKTLIHELIKAKREYCRLVSDREPQFELGEPCTPKQLAMLENIIKKPLPPSYRAFLELHNGWDGFDGLTKLLSVEDQKEDWVISRVKTLSSLFGAYADEDPFKEGAIPVLIGRDEPVFTVLDPRKVRKNGEMKFVTYELTQEQDDFPDFIAFLEDDLAVTQELIKEEREGIVDADDEEEV